MYTVEGFPYLWHQLTLAISRYLDILVENCKCYMASDITCYYLFNIYSTVYSTEK